MDYSQIWTKGKAIVREKLEVRNLLILLSLSYVLAMFVYPWIDACLSGKQPWKYVHGVWHDWQSLNASFVAIIASLFLAKVVAERERKRELLLAKSAIAKVHFPCAEILGTITDWARILNDINESTHVEPARFVTISLDNLNTIAEPIQFLDQNEAKVLSKCLSELQVVQSRIRNAMFDQKDFGTSNLFESYALSMMRTHAGFCRILVFAREFPITGTTLQSGELKKDELVNSMRNLNLETALENSPLVGGVIERAPE